VTSRSEVIRGGRQRLRQQPRKPARFQRRTLRGKREVGMARRSINVVVALLCTSVANCSQDPLNVDTSPRPVSEQVDRCFAQWGVSPITSQAPELKKCIVNSIYVQNSGADISKDKMSTMGFDCVGSSEVRCILISTSRVYGLGLLTADKDSFTDSENIVELTYRGSKIASIAIQEKNVTVIDRRITDQFGPYRTDDAVP
jgi:hypothetical protein